MNVCREDEGISGSETSLMPEVEDTSPWRVGRETKGTGVNDNGSTEPGYTDEGTDGIKERKVKTRHKHRSVKSKQ